MAKIFHFSLVSFHDGTTEEQFGPSADEGDFGTADKRRISCT